MPERSVATLQITVSGTPLDAVVLRDVLDVTVNDTLDHASAFTIRLNSWDLDRNLVTWVDNPLFAIGRKVEIAMGYVGGVFSPVMAGEVVKLEMGVAAAQPPTLTVTGYDARYQMARVPENPEPYKNETDSGIASKVLQRHHLPAEVIPTTITYSQVSQNNQSDLDFLNDLAWKNGYDLLVTSTGTVRFGPPLLDGAPIPLSLEEDIQELNLTVSGEKLVEKVTLRGRDKSQEKDFEGQDQVETFPGTLPFDQLTTNPVKLVDWPAATQA
jgi:phage protein D